MSRRDDLAGALATVRTRLTDAAEAAGRDPADIELLPVTKFFPASDVALLADLGCRAFGESRDQEAAAKVAELAGRIPAEVRWHMIGKIQSNKARHIASWADVVHSVSSLKVITALGRGAQAALDEGARTEPVQIYLQLSLDGDESRGGVDIAAPDRIDALRDAVTATPGLEFVGFMAIPPLAADPDAAFASLAAERDRVQPFHQRRLGLSAGMSGDLEVAIKHGSTCVRVGTALLGSRPLTSP